MGQFRQHISRQQYRQVEVALEDTRIVSIQGARQTGKTTLAKEIAIEKGGLYLTLDTAAVRESAAAHPEDFVRQAADRLMVIDEVQRVPALILAIKEVVDGSSRPGQFLITGSSDLSALKDVRESLAGRMESIELAGLSQAERAGADSAFLSRAFSGADEFLDDNCTSSLQRADYIQLAMIGGYPEALARSSDARRDAWFANYLKLLFEQDSRRDTSLNATSALPKLLRYIASISGTQLVVSNIATDLGETRAMLGRYLSLLETLFLIKLIPAWFTNRTSRATKHPKAMLLDSGLTAHLLDAASTTPTDLLSPIAGKLFEAFVFSELHKAMLANDAPFALHHYRDSRGHEVDFVIEDRRGQVILVEAKTSSSAFDSDFRHMRYLQEQHPDSVKRSILIYTGSRALPFGERQVALPAELLWRGALSL
jgi:predicted AAA+ superfamily ATPase